MAAVDVLMPKMGESITEGTVLVWHKKPGDPVELDETLLEIGTDKVDTEIPSPSGGIVAEILVEEGATVDVGTLIARIEDPQPDGSSRAPAPAAPDPVAPEPSAIEAAPVVDASSSTTVDIIMPKMGESITEGTVIAWYKEVGDAVALDETVLEIGTDKVDTEVPSPAAGTLEEVLVEMGATVEVGTPLARIAIGKAAATSAPVPAPAAPTPAYVPQEEPTAGDTVEAPTRHLRDGRFLTPLVRTIAQKEGVTTKELESIRGTGSRGRIGKKDLLKYLQDRRSPQPPPPVPTPTRTPAKPAPAPAPKAAPAGAREEVIEMDRLRQLVAHHMTLSRKTSAHVTSFAEVDATNLVRLRESNKHRFLKRDGVKLTYTPFLVYAAVEALRDHPMLNASVDGTRIILKKDFHVGIAVNIAKTGLIVPVIRHAGRQRVAGLAHTAHDLAQRARSGDLQPDDLQGGTFSITNLGSLGSIMGTPIILQPQVAILATGAIIKRPVVVEDPALGDVIAIRHMMYLSLSYDHRIIDGAMGISFLRKFVEVVENFDPNGEV